jgi:hypothetical protein
MLPKIEFEYDQPVTLHLRYTQGLEVPSKYYERWPGRHDAVRLQCRRRRFLPL